MIPVITRQHPLTRTDKDFLLLIDKPEDWTSFDVVKKIRNITRLKTGHAGTLDPFATGLLILGVGAGTKTLGELSGLSKWYEVCITFGAETDSMDRTGRETDRTDNLPTQEEIERQLNLLKEEYLQLPPMFSAKKIAGQRLYRAARQGREIEREAVRVTLFDYSITEWDGYDLHIRLHVSKGTYIRSLASDLGKLCSSLAFVKDLRRTAIGQYQLSDSLTIPGFQALWQEQEALQ
jgi:tRNA pseudouridine55 synthase